MAKLGVGKKAERVLRFLMGLRHPKVARALLDHGFTEQELEEGWRRLRGLSECRLLVTAMPEPNARAIELLDEFENKWFPVCRATLKARFPTIAEHVFGNLPQVSGSMVAITVITFLERVDSMGRGLEPYFEQGPQARALLESRGLTEQVVAEARETVAGLARVSELPEEYPMTREDSRAAEDALWKWYLEWSAIARATVKDRRLLRGMGFLSSRKSSGSSEEKVDVAV